MHENVYTFIFIVMKGIYKIINKTNNRYYVGSSVHIIKRLRDHKNDLNKNKHVAKKLQSAWNEEGAVVFEFKLIEELPSSISVENLLVTEQKYLDIAKADNSYNTLFTAIKRKEPRIGTEESLLEQLKVFRKSIEIGTNKFFGYVDGSGI